MVKGGDRHFATHDADASKPSVSALEQEIQVNDMATESVRKPTDTFLAHFL